MGSDAIRVLLVEDVEDDYLFTRQVLSHIPDACFELDWVDNYDKALDTMAQHPYDVYLLDYKLGSHTGLELLQAIQLSQVPVILLTGVGGFSVDLEAMHLGVSTFLPKADLTTASLERSIRYALKQKQAEQALRDHADVLETLVEQRTLELQQQNAELLKVQGQLQAALAQEAALNQAKDRLLAMLSHELRTPLSVIQGACDLLEIRLPTELGEWGNARLQTINRAIEQITQVVENSLLLVQIDTGRLQLRATPLELVQFCADLIDTWDLPKGSTHQLQFTTQSQSCSLAFDPSLLKRLLKNLIENAIRYSPEGGRIVLKLFSLPEEIVLSLNDSGIGIPPAEIGQVCDRFYKASNANAIAGTPGAGLGLAVAQEIVTLFQGKLEIQSQLNQGTTLILRFPKTS